MRIFLDPWVSNFEKIEVGHACLVCGLQRELKIQKVLFMKSLKLRGQSGVSDIFGILALDHLLHFVFFLIYVSWFPLIPKLGI